LKIHPDAIGSVHRIGSSDRSSDRFIGSVLVHAVKNGYFQGLKPSSVKLSIEKIKNDPDFKLLDKITYDQIADFAGDYLRKSNLSIRTYLMIIILAFLGLIVSYIHGNIVHNYSLIGVLKQYLYGLLISFTIVIPVHEIIHGLAYFILGARKIRFGAKLKQFAFYSVAEDFVTNRTAFYILALSPFIILSVANLYGFFYVRGIAGYTYLSILFFHSTMCAGDFALMSYYEIHKNKELYTFDDVKNRISYFYYRKQK